MKFELRLDKDVGHGLKHSTGQTKLATRLQKWSQSNVALQECFIRNTVVAAAFPATSKDTVQLGHNHVQRIGVGLVAFALVAIKQTITEELRVIWFEGMTVLADNLMENLTVQSLFHRLGRELQKGRRGKSVLCGIELEHFVFR
jgi:hypothetical protein